MSLKVRVSSQLAVIVTTLTATGLLLYTIHQPISGEYHPPHTSPKTLVLSNDITYTQHFLAEYSAIDGLYFELKPFAKTTGQLIITVQAKNHSSRVELDVADIAPSGQVYVPLPQAIATRGTNANFTLLAQNLTEPLGVLFQIDSTKFTNGHISQTTFSLDETKDIAGHLAFQVHYQPPVIERLPFAPIWLGLIGLVTIIMWMFAWPSNTTPSPDRIQWHRHDLPALSSALVIVVSIYGAALLPHLNQWPQNTDFVKDTLYQQTIFSSLSAGHLPWWQFATCGGQPIIGNPEVPLISLGLPLSFLFDPIIAIKLMLILEASILTIGSYLLARSLGLGPIGALVPTLIIPLHAFAPNRILLGHTMYTGGFALMPWVLGGFLHSFTRKKWLIGTSVLLALMFYRGDTRILFYTLIVLALWTLIEAMRAKKTLPLLTGSLVVIIFILISTPKLLPALESTDHFTSNSLPSLAVPLVPEKILDNVFFDRQVHEQPINVANGEAEGWENIGLYVGLLPAILALIGIAASPAHLRYLLLVPAIVFLVLGEGTIYNEVLQDIPLVRILFRLPSRLLVMTIITASILAGLAVQMMWQKWHRPGQIVAIVIITLITVDLGLLASSTLNRAQYSPPVAIPQRSTPLLEHSNANTHPLSIIQARSTVPGMCPDFNRLGDFAKNDLPKPMIISNHPQNTKVILSSQSLTIQHDSNDRILTANLMYSPHVIVNGAHALPRTDHSIQLITNPHSTTTTIRYQNNLLYPSLLLAFGTLTASILHTTKIKSPTNHA